MAWVSANRQSADGCDRAARRWARAGWHCAALVLLALAVGCPCPELRADSGTTVAVPLNTKVKNGLRLNIDTRWVDANGYRPVRIEAINWPPGPTPADRSFRIVIKTHGYMWGTNSQTVSEYLELLQGASRAAITMSVPQNLTWNTAEVEVYEDGRRLQDLDFSFGIPNRGGYSWTESVPAILFIDAEAPTREQRLQLVQTSRFGGTRASDVPRTLPDIRYLAAVFPDSNMSGNVPATNWAEQVADVDTLAMLQDLPRFDMLPPAELPDKWIDYTCFDLVCISRRDLQQLVEQSPGPWQAIRAWLATGPTLCVYDMPLDGTALAELDQLLGLPSGDPHPDESSPSAWKFPRVSNVGGGIRGMSSAVYPDQPREIIDEAAAEPGDPEPSAKPFAIRRVELGRVVAIAAADPFGGRRREVDWLFNELDPSTWMWYQRHGISLHRENGDYWNLMIPGVGRAPVGSYLVLITLFVVVIGPLNYYWLQKNKRLYLLLVTVPLGAGLVTIALLNYALFTDGLGVRVRVRSYTQLDQRNQRAVSWSRQSYYAGLAPSGGMVFPAAAAIYPIEQNPADYRNVDRNRRLLWNDGQHLLAGYMTARSTSQFLVVHSCPSERGLLVSEPAGDTAPPSVQNRLGADIARLVLRDSAGRLHVAENLASGRSAPLQPIEEAAAAADLKQWYSAGRPQFPAGYDRNYYGSTFGFRRYSPWYGTDQNLPPPNLELGMLERSLRAAAQTGIKDLPPRTYLAVMQSGVETPLGYQRVTEEASIHLVRGEW